MPPIIWHTYPRCVHLFLVTVPFLAVGLIYSQLPDQIQDFYTEEYNQSATAAVLTFLRRELIQQILLLLLDDDFMYTYIHGDIVECGDGVTRRQFPRFVLHIADYVEKYVCFAAHAPHLLISVQNPPRMPQILRKVSLSSLQDTEGQVDSNGDTR